MRPPFQVGDVVEQWRHWEHEGWVLGPTEDQRGTTWRVRTFPSAPPNQQTFDEYRVVGR